LETAGLLENKPLNIINTPISGNDSLALSNLPEIEMPDYSYKTTLPSIHDNSDQPYYRELFGKCNFKWRPLNSDGYNLQSGVFYCQIKFGDHNYARKLILLNNR